MKSASKDIEIENVALTPRNGGEYAANGTASPAVATQKRSRVVHIGVAAFFLINIIVLYILHFADRGDPTSTKAGSAIAGKFSTSSLSASSGSSSSASSSASLAEGQAVSFTTEGQLAVGAGTTAYLAATTLPADQKSIQHIHFTKLGTSKKAYNTNLVSYQQGTAPSLESVVTVLSKTANKKELTITPYASKNVITGSTIKGLATLSDSLAVAVTTTTASNGLSYLVDVYPIKIANSDVEVQAKTFAVNNSATNFVSRVSDSSFAITYYEPYSATADYFQRVMVGSIAADGAVTFSDSLVFGKANGAKLTTIGHPQPVFNTSDRFTIPWFVDSFSATKNNRTIDGSVGLCLTTVSYDASSTALSSPDPVCNTDFQPAYFIDSTQLSDTVVAFIFFDRANNFALTVATVQFSAITSIPTFRSSFVIDEAAGAFDFGSADGFSPQPTLQALSSSRIAVSFMNPSNSGKPSVKVLKYSNDLSLSSVSPVLPISNADFSVVSVDPKAYGSIVLDVLPLESGFAVGYAGLWAGIQNQRIALVESMGKPVGVVSSKDGSDISVATSGTVDVSGVTSGRTYYASTEGALYTPSSTTTDDFVLVQDNNVVISKDALVGVAISDKKIFVTGQQ
jgi:hypothetical protein